MARLFVNKRVRWNDAGSIRAGRVKQLYSDHVLVTADSGGEYIVNSSVVESEPRVAVASTSPRFASKCSTCQFLGRYGRYDLWWYPQGGKPTVVARYGEGENDYYAGAMTTVLPLREAVARAEDMGLSVEKLAASEPEQEKCCGE